MADTMPSSLRLPLRTRARAKINLSLHVLGRRADGYHALESLVAFAGVGDTLSLAPDQPLSLSISGPMAAGLAVSDDNLVLRAARALAEAAPGVRSGAFHLVKRLPVASGIGGGSADAAAALRLLARLNGLRDDDPRLFSVARQIGADVPVCLLSRPVWMRGVGDELQPACLPRLFALLVNPGVAVSTAEVFGALGLAHGARFPAPAGEAPRGAFDGDAPALIAGLAHLRNDLEAPALRLAPVIGEVLQAAQALPGCRLARMSGSGATCFALFDDCRASAAAGKRLARAHPDWWIRPTVLG
jgi:4-diphosphocytidyl-2-C-methyl-D-erythritol kinase